MKRLITIIFLSLTISACSTSVETRQTEGEGSIKYRIIEIEGMPCVWAKQVQPGNTHAGLSCDWSQWERK